MSVSSHDDQHYGPRESAKLLLHERIARAERRRRVEAARWADTLTVRNHLTKLSKGGPRVLLEFLTEVRFANRCAGDIADRLAAWSSLSSEALQVTGGDRLGPWRPLLIPITKFPEAEP